VVEFVRLLFYLCGAILTLKQDNVLRDKCTRVQHTSLQKPLKHV